MTRVFLFSFFLSLPLSFGLSLQSSIPSQVPGLPMRNSHRLTPQIYRGQGFNIPAPPGRNRPAETAAEREARYQEISAFLNFQSPESQNSGQKFTDVLIFKNSTARGDEEITREKEALSAQGLRVLQIPFQWRDIVSFRVACEQSLEALKLIHDVVQDPARMLYFHCTVGEDRTGLLAGLFWLLNGNGPIDRVYREEMCWKGYERGDPQKDPAVAQIIRSSLGPVFFGMASKIQAGLLSWNNLDLAQCLIDPGLLPVEPLYQWQNYRCESSPLAEVDFNRRP